MCYGEHYKVPWPKEVETGNDKSLQLKRSVDLCIFHFVNTDITSAEKILKETPCLKPGVVRIVSRNEYYSKIPGQ